MTGRITAMGFEEVLVGVVRAGGSGGAGGGGRSGPAWGAVRRVVEGAGDPPLGPARSGRAGRDRRWRPARHHHRGGPAHRGAGVGGPRAGGGRARSGGARRLVMAAECERPCR